MAFSLRPVPVGANLPLVRPDPRTPHIQDFRRMQTSLTLDGRIARYVNHRMIHPTNVATSEDIRYLRKINENNKIKFRISKR